MSVLIRYTETRERPSDRGPSQILLLPVAVEVVTPSAVAVAGASAHGTAILVATPIGRCVAGGSANGVATLIASPVGTSVAGASTNGVATLIASPVGTSVAGASANGVAALVAIPTGVSVAGSLAMGSAALTVIPVGSSVAGASTQGTATSGTVISASGTAFAGASAQGTAALTVVPSGTSVAGSLTYGVSEIPGVISPTGVSVAGSSAQGVASKTAIPFGVMVGGAISYGLTIEDVIAMAEDMFVVPLMNQILTCLCEEAQNQPNPPQHCCFRVGPEVAHDAGLYTDLCCEGIGYVSLGDTFPSSASFPEQDIVRQANTVCAPPSWAQYFKVGIIRCAPTGDEDPPTCTDWQEAAFQNISDALTLRRTACCIRDFVVNNDDLFLGMSVVMERHVQGTPLGGCVERAFNIAIQIPNCDC